MFTLQELTQDRQFSKLDKSGQDLVAALAEALIKASQAHGAGESPSLTGELERLSKSNPQVSDVHVSTELTNLSVAYIQDESNFLASSAGFVPVQNQADAYMEYDRLDMFRVDEDDAMRVPGTESAGSGFDTTFPTYSCQPWAWHKDVDEGLQANQRVGDPVDDALAYVVQTLMIIREKIWAARLFATGLWDIDLDGVAGAPGANQFQQWDQAAAKPRSDISLQAVKIHEKTGLWPNVFSVQPYVLMRLLLNAEIVDAFKYTTAGATPTLQQLAAALVAGGVLAATPPMIKIAGGIQTTSRKGAAAGVTGYIASKSALLAHVAPRPGLRTASAWYTFGWSGLLGSNANGVRIKDFEIVERGITHRVEGDMYLDIKKVSAFLGAFFESAVA